MPQTHGLLTREMQAAPKAAFMRSLLSHIMRLRLADLTHRDLLHVLQLVKDSSLGHDLPKPWTQDSALRILDRFNAHLFNGTVKTVADTMYWQDQPLIDLMYTGTGAPPPPPTGSSGPTCGTLGVPHDVMRGGGSAAAACIPSVARVAFHRGERHLVSGDLLLADGSEFSHSSLSPAAVVATSAVVRGFTTDVQITDSSVGSVWCEPGSEAGRETFSGEDTMHRAPQEIQKKPGERWAYRKVYSIVQDSKTVILGSLRVRFVLWFWAYLASAVVFSDLFSALCIFCVAQLGQLLHSLAPVCVPERSLFQRTAPKNSAFTPARSVRWHTYP